LERNVIVEDRGMPGDNIKANVEQCVVEGFPDAHYSTAAAYVSPDGILTAYCKQNMIFVRDSTKGAQTPVCLMNNIKILERHSE
jgi:hypothetical protein